MIKAVTDLEIYTLAYKLAMDVFESTRSFPKEEKYSLTSQVVRSSRSIAANIAEGWGKRSYENEFKRHLIYAMGSLEETKTWIAFAKDCNYLDEVKFNKLMEALNETGSKIFKLYSNWQTF